MDDRLIDVFIFISLIFIILNFTISRSVALFWYQNPTLVYEFVSGFIGTIKILEGGRKQSVVFSLFILLTSWWMSTLNANLPVFWGKRFRFYQFFYGMYVGYIIVLSGIIYRDELLCAMGFIFGALNIGALYYSMVPSANVQNGEYVVFLRVARIFMMPGFLIYLVHLSLCLVNPEIEIWTSLGAVELNIYLSILALAVGAASFRWQLQLFYYLSFICFLIIASGYFVVTHKLIIVYWIYMCIFFQGILVFLSTTGGFVSESQIFFLFIIFISLVLVLSGYIPTISTLCSSSLGRSFSTCGLLIQSNLG